MHSLRISWPLLLSGVTFVAAILMCSETGITLVKYQVVFYFTRQITFLFTLLIIPVSLFITLFQFRHSSQSTLAIILSLLILGVSNILACGSSFALMLNPSFQIESASSKDRIYHLDAMLSPEIGGGVVGTLMLWKCDRIGVFCQIIDAEKFYDGMKPIIELAPNNSSLLFKIDDEVVFTCDDR